MNDHANPQRRQFSSHASPDSLSDDHDVGCQIISHVSEVINVTSWDHQTFARARGAECHEGHDSLVRIDNARFGATSGDVAEWACNVSVRSWHVFLSADST